VKNIDRLKEIVDYSKTYIYQLPYKDNDVRRAYCENLYSILNQFYLGKVYFEISSQIKEDKIKFDSDIMINEWIISHLLVLHQKLMLRLEVLLHLHLFLRKLNLKE